MLQKTWYMMGRFIVQQYLRHVMHVDIVKDAPLPPGPKILIANHPSTSDPAFVTTLIKEQASILILETLFKVPLFGQSLRMAGHVPVRAENGRAALEEGLRLLKSGRTIIIFPEGAISPAEGGFLKAHTGAARLALCSGLPVVPVGISLDKKRVRIIHTQVDGKSEFGTWYLDGPYAMTVGEAVTFSGDTEDRQQVRAVTEQMMQHIERLSHRSETRLLQQALGQGALERRAAFPRRSLGAAVRQVNHLYTRSATLHMVQSSLLFFMLFARHF